MDEKPQDEMLTQEEVMQLLGEHVVMLRMANKCIARLAQEKGNLTAALAEATKQ